MAKSAIIFKVTPCGETGGYVARWDAPGGKGGITTQGESLADLEEMISDAVTGYFEGAKSPRQVRLHFAEDPFVALKVAA